MIKSGHLCISNHRKSCRKSVLSCLLITLIKCFQDQKSHGLLSVFQMVFINACRFPVMGSTFRRGQFQKMMKSIFLVLNIPFLECSRRMAWIQHNYFWNCAFAVWEMSRPPTFLANPLYKRTHTCWDFLGHSATKMFKWFTQGGREGCNKIWNWSVQTERLENLVWSFWKAKSSPYIGLIYGCKF